LKEFLTFFSIGAVFWSLISYFMGLIDHAVYSTLLAIYILLFLKAAE